MLIAHDKIRYIQGSGESGEKETIVFTYDFDSPADDWMAPGLTIDKDEILEHYELPDGFPTDTALVRESW